MSRVAVDLDGTLVENRWPKLGDWLPGAQEAMRTLLDAGHTVYVYSARVAPLWPDGSEREPAHVFTAIQGVRDLLDRAGLPEMEIWQGSGKPHYDLLIDDKAIHFPGGRRSWDKILPRALARVGDEDTFAEVMKEADETTRGISG